nr:putative geopeptide radical SAM maturase [Desulfobacterales bacterium]
MQLSYYIKAYPYGEGSRHQLLYSTKKASLILIREETYQRIEEGTLPPPDEQQLRRLGMMVDDQEEEKRAVLDLFDELNARNPGLNLTVVLNLDCNFSCLYCYEGGTKGRLYMSEETAHLLVDFIKERFTRNKRYLLIDFYGGEPLLTIGLIKSISKALKPLIEGKGGSYHFTLVTNGSLFKREVAEELTPLGLETVKITLDGPAEVHDRYRPFRSGAGSFDTIIRNIKDTCDLVKIGIGGNFERTNYKRFVHLLDYLMDEGLTPEKIGTVKFDPVMKRPQGDMFLTDYKGGCMSINEPWLIEASAMLREEILKRGYKTPRIAPILCMVENRDAFVVNFDGVLYKCPAFIGKEDFAVGDLQTGVRDYTDSYQLGIWKNEECAECVYLPLCFGGCRYMTYIRDGEIDKLDCRKAYLDASLETLVKQDITYRPRAG